MPVIKYISITIITFVIMEAITWLTHKYVMHGFLWYLHEDHHRPKYKNLFEKNDLFFVIFAIPSSLLIIYGIKYQLNFLFFIGLGILIYGICYFIVHDVIIHRRFKWFNNIKWRYIQALRKGHKMHHKQMGKDADESFGMLWVPWKYFKEKYTSYN
ncbi:MAG: beta-carotene hydroxylase [Crocinitomicaceae bacterium]|nr:beta-carotene hydroxylase [Crocinitomicaceae bacterium]